MQLNKGKRQSTPEKRVARGAAWLDRVKPDWFNHIDLEQLDLSSGCSCVLGQICISEFAAHAPEAKRVFGGTYAPHGGYGELVVSGNDVYYRMQEIRIRKNKLSTIDKLKNLVIPKVTAKRNGFELTVAQQVEGSGAEWRLLTNLWREAIITRRALARASV